MSELANKLVLLQSILVSTAIIIASSAIIVKYAIFHFHTLEWFVDYMRHRRRFQKYMEQEGKK